MLGGRVGRAGGGGKVGMNGILGRMGGNPKEVCSGDKKVTQTG